MLLFVLTGYHSELLRGSELARIKMLCHLSFADEDLDFQLAISEFWFGEMDEIKLR